jgi:Pentapeptide repeats (8 copies)
LALLWLVWWRLPKRHADRLRLTIRDPKARADVEDNIRKTVGQLLGGMAVLIGAALAYPQFTQQQRTSQQQFAQQQQASHELLTSNQVSKGFEQLGNDKVVVRLGGIYALEGVMNTSGQYHRPVLEALSTFVRDGTRTATGDGPPAPDIQAALTVIGRRIAIETALPELANAHIPQAYLRGANLSRAYLLGADLRVADLSGADLLSANLSGASLRGAHLSGADSRAGVSGPTITQAQLDEGCGKDAKLEPDLTLKPCPAAPIQDRQP